MGAVLDTPSVCPLCKELVGDPIILKCKHRYCRRCIGDLWSITPSGPYKCPEWKCKTVYNTLPFGTRSATEPGSSGQAPPQGTSSNPKWERPPFTNVYLGKRKASAPVDDRPDPKRPAVARPHPVAPSNEPPEAPTTTPPPVPFARDESPPSPDDDHRSSDHSEEPVEEASEAPARHTKPDTEPEEVLTMDDSSRSSSEEDAFVPALAAPPPDLGGTARVSWISPLFAHRPKLTATRRLSPGPSSPRRSPMAPRPTISPPPVPSYPQRSPMAPRPTASPTPPVPCHYCAGGAQQPAVKTCLVCGASMCAEHLRPHLDSPVFRSHTLVPPLEDLSAWRCPEHQEMSRIYCRQCAVCVCTVCTVIGSHRDHACVSIREAERELRGNLKAEIQQLQESENTLIQRLAGLREKKLDFEGVLEEARSAVQQQYAAMREALEQEEQSALQCVVQEEARSVGGLEGHLSRLQGSLTCVQKGLHTLEGLADAKGEQRVQEQAFIMEYSKITQMFSEAGPGVVDLDPQEEEEVDRARLHCLKSWTEKRLNTLVISLPERDPLRLLYGTVPSLDADTAHPKLLLSPDYRQVSYGEVQQAYSEQGARFSSFPQVLASEAMDQGRWYWEVEVSSEDAGQWKVGVSEAQIGRKGQKGNCRLGLNPFSWCLGAERGKVEAMHDRASASVAVGRLQRIGVFLDCDEGVLSFFNVTPGGALALLHTYKQEFAEPLYPAFSVCKAQLTICDLFKMSDPE
ncbi:E3 ubiquitin/ISG15 ligase TRIM25 [Gadus morhua]|uniref:Si:dkey-29p10.4 n=1 Tax=Gadus morhua TaxID=8049 RepID=A0A8C5A9U4_GADMO|nr:E3 ubiquitin/ISG15 ligase TRIM25-like [Gadus morhua]XP_030222279.1 E3 ubiquitin/ISG15 ligase TRIM25-like [Gadus morhua]